MRLFSLAAAILLSCLPPPYAAAADARLHMEQQQHALELRLRQSAGARRHDLSPNDARRLDQLHLQQRMEQQHLELQQSSRDHALRRQARVSPSESTERRIEMQREIFAQERELQNQRFELDRQRLLQSAPRQPLQPPIGSAQLQ